MPKYAVIYWKSLDQNNITLKEFEDEKEMGDFVEAKSISGYGVIVCEENFVNSKKEKVYKIRPTPTYNFFKKIYIYVGFFLVTIIILIILLWKYDLS
jgi:hypothetical protein